MAVVGEGGGGVRTLDCAFVNRFIIPGMFCVLQ